MGFSKAIVLLSLLALFYGTIGTSDDETEKDGGANEVLTSADDATDNEVEGTRTAQKRKHTMAQKEETEDKSRKKRIKTSVTRANVNKLNPEFFSALERFVNDTVKRPLQEVADEFTIPGSPQNFSQCAQKKECNRYEDIICVEETEVRLNNGRYIHANWIEFNGEKRFICTQGPLVSTSKDFWTMVVQENIQSIVMLCNTVEDAKDKCAQYWPTAENEVLSFDKNQQITVKFEKEQLVEGTVYRTDLIVYAPQMGQGVLHVKHFHWREWPDHGVPKNDLALFHLLEHIQEVQQSVVHCSAGVGRTGTLVAISLAIQTLHLGLPLDISTLVCEIRQQRAQSVQKLGQYLYIYFVILNYAKNNASKLKLENTDSFNAFLKELEGMISRG